MASRHLEALSRGWRARQTLQQVLHTSRFSVAAVASPQPVPPSPLTATSEALSAKPAEADGGGDKKADKPKYSDYYYLIRGGAFVVFFAVPWWLITQVRDDRETRDWAEDNYPGLLVTLRRYVAIPHDQEDVYRLSAKVSGPSVVGVDVTQNGSEQLHVRVVASSHISQFLADHPTASRIDHVSISGSETHQPNSALSGVLSRLTPLRLWLRNGYADLEDRVSVAQSLVHQSQLLAAIDADLAVETAAGAHTASIAALQVQQQRQQGVVDGLSRALAGFDDRWWRPAEKKPATSATSQPSWWWSWPSASAAQTAALSPAAQAAADLAVHHDTDASLFTKPPTRRMVYSTGEAAAVNNRIVAWGLPKPPPPPTPAEAAGAAAAAAGGAPAQSLTDWLTEAFLGKSAAAAGVSSTGNDGGSSRKDEERDSKVSDEGLPALAPLDESDLAPQHQTTSAAGSSR